ncbi:MAG: hypothetical protein L0Z62_22905 [Gemmataceae bacterium]|nr:hypothetical protein [Gemmataceae bacterium]
MRWLWQPKHTFRSGLLRIIEGLENGSVVLAHPETSAPTPTASAPADLVRAFPTFLDKIDELHHKLRGLELGRLLTAIGMFLGGVGLVIGGVVWPFWPFIILGSISCLGSIWPFRLAARARYHRIRGELLAAILRATPAEERPWQFLRLSPQLKEDLEKAGVEVNPLFQQVKRAFDGWRVTPPTTLLPT